MFSKALQVQARRWLKRCEERGIRLATAESCTGGLIAALLTEIPGSSKVFECGFITYSDAAKQSLLGVKLSLLRRHGAVSGQVAKAMAEGALKSSKADISIAVTGIAGPGGGSKEKPVGLVYIAVSLGRNKTVVEEHFFHGNRAKIRLETVSAALKLARECAARSA